MGTRTHQRTTGRRRSGKEHTAHIPQQLWRRHGEWTGCSVLEERHNLPTAQLGLNVLLTPKTVRPDPSRGGCQPVSRSWFRAVARANFLTRTSRPALSHTSQEARRQHAAVLLHKKWKDGDLQLTQRESQTKEQAVRIESTLQEECLWQVDSNLGAVVGAEEGRLNRSQAMKEELPKHG